MIFMKIGLFKELSEHLKNALWSGFSWFSENGRGSMYPANPRLKSASKTRVGQ